MSIQLIQVEYHERATNAPICMTIHFSNTHFKKLCYISYTPLLSRKLNPDMASFVKLRFSMETFEIH